MRLDENINEFDINARNGNSAGIADGRSTMAWKKCVSTIGETGRAIMGQEQNENHAC
jgi:hypothetical protein